MSEIRVRCSLAGERLLFTMQQNKIFIILFQKINIVEHVEEGLKVGKYREFCIVDYHLAFSVWSLDQYWQAFIVVCFNWLGDCEESKFQEKQ